MREGRHNVPDEHIFFVCERFLKGEGATNIARWLRNQHFDVTREQVYSLVRQGIELGYLKLCPPQNMVLTQRLQAVYPQAAADIQVLDVETSSALDHLTMATAEKVLLLIREWARRDTPVHIGLGAGRTAERFARNLALRLRSEPLDELPKLVVHALTSGFSPRKPTTHPVSFFSFFEWLGSKIEYVGMFSEPFIPWDQYDSVASRLGVREAFDERDQIDIIISSFSGNDDPHGLFNEFFQMGSPQGFDDLHKAGWVGDVQWRPYSNEGPINVDTGIRPVTLFELDDLVRMARTPNKHVFLIAGPCPECKKDKSRALRPLMMQPNLRVFNHLVTDAVTAHARCSKSRFRSQRLGERQTLFPAEYFLLCSLSLANNRTR